VRRKQIKREARDAREGKLFGFHDQTFAHFARFAFDPKRGVISEAG
jgi:hypothetical protein